MRHDEGNTTGKGRGDGNVDVDEDEEIDGKEGAGGEGETETGEGEGGEEEERCLESKVWICSSVRVRRNWSFSRAGAAVAFQKACTVSWCSRVERWRNTASLAHDELHGWHNPC